MCLCIDIYMYACMYVCLDRCIYIINRSIDKQTNMYIYIYIHMYVCTDICIYTYVCLHMYIDANKTSLGPSGTPRLDLPAEPAFGMTYVVLRCSSILPRKAALHSSPVGRKRSFGRF